MLLDNEVPKLISKEIINELYNLSNILSFAQDDKIFLNKLFKRSEKENTLYIENNIEKTLSNIDEDFNKEHFTGKELKEIISSFKTNQYNMSLLKIIKEICEQTYNMQFLKENEKLIDTVDIFAIIYIIKNIEDLSEKCLLDEKSFFYDVKKFENIFSNCDETDNMNPFVKFLNEIPNIEIKNEALIDKQSIDDLFYID